MKILENKVESAFSHTRVNTPWFGMVHGMQQKNKSKKCCMQQSEQQLVLVYVTTEQQTTNKLCLLYIELKTMSGQVGGL